MLLHSKANPRYFGGGRYVVSILYASNNPMKIKLLFLTIGLVLGVAGGLFAGLWLSTYDFHGVQWRFSDAASRGSLIEVEKLYAEGAKIDAIPMAADGAVSGAPALSAAAYGGHADVVEWLLDHGADPNMLVSDGRPLDGALNIQNDAAKTVAILKAHGAKSMLNQNQ